MQDAGSGVNETWVKVTIKENDWGVAVSSESEGGMVTIEDLQRGGSN